MKFKVGDKVQCIDSSNSGNRLTKDKIYDVLREGTHGIWIKNDEEQEEDLFEYRFELSNHKLKAPTHLVIWDEEDKDPYRFFTDDKKAKEFMKELSEKSDVMQDSVILVEIKSAQKVSITKIVRLKGYKI